MSVGFYDWIIVLDGKSKIFSELCSIHNNNNNCRTLLQKKVDKERFRKNKIEAYNGVITKVLMNKIKKYKENEKHSIYLYNNQDILWQLFGISSLPDDKHEKSKLLKFLELYKIIKNIKYHNKKHINKEYFFKAMNIL